MARIIEGYVFMSAAEAGLGSEHFAGVTEALAENNARAEARSDQELLDMANSLLKKEGSPLLTIEELR